MSARRSDDAQRVLVDAARAALADKHPLRASRLLSDCWRLGPMSRDIQTDFDALVAEIDRLRPAA